MSLPVSIPKNLHSLSSPSFCFNFSCSKASSSSFICPYCPKISFCSSQCQNLHQKETHNDKKNSEKASKPPIFPEIRENFEIVSSLSSFFYSKGAPFEQIPKDFYKLKRKKPSENYILIIVIVILFLISTFLLKKINKSDLAANTIEQILLSCTQHQKFSHPHLLKLIQLFDKNGQIGLVYEPFTQRTLAALLKQKKTLMERNAFIYFTQICLAVDFLHKKGLFGLNLQLNNLLLDEKLDLKMSDYSFFPKEFRNYSPESLKNIAKSVKTDTWTLGVLLFELIHGYFPYKGKTFEEKSANIIIDNRKKFASFISDEAQDLMNRALNPDPEKRLSLKEIFEHKWMQKFYKLFKVDIEKFQQPEKKIRNSAMVESKWKIDNIRRKSSHNLDAKENLERKTTEPGERKEILPLKIFAEEFSFRLQNIKLRTSIESQNNNSNNNNNNNNLKSFTFYKSSSPSSNPNMNSSCLLKSSENSGKNKGRIILEDSNLTRPNEIETGDLLKLKPCEDPSFWKKFSNFIGCGCFIKQ